MASKHFGDGGINNVLFFCFFFMQIDEYFAVFCQMVMSINYWFSSKISLFRLLFIVLE
jgi:hypothetical protein